MGSAKSSLLLILAATFLIAEIPGGAEPTKVEEKLIKTSSARKLMVLLDLGGIGIGTGFGGGITGAINGVGSGNAGGAINIPVSIPINIPKDIGTDLGGGSTGTVNGLVGSGTAVRGITGAAGNGAAAADGIKN